VRRGDRIDHYETVRRHKDGSLIEISLTVSPVIDEHGAIIGVSKIARDITQRKRAEEALRAADRARTSSWQCSAMSFATLSARWRVPSESSILKIDP